MVLNFKVVFWVLATAAAQNTTDYDYETTVLNETSTEYITELPKTSTMMATTVLPSEENYWVLDDHLDSHFCQCNLKIKECDINCCCDVDCTKDMLKAFDCLVGVSYQMKERNACHKKKGWLCIFKGLGERVEMYNELLRPVAIKNTWNQGFKESEDLMFSNEYKIGHPVLFYSEVNKEYSTLDLPHLFGVPQPIRHLHPWITKGASQDFENITHILTTPTENTTRDIEFFICDKECVATKNRTLPRNPSVIEFIFRHNFTSLVSLRVNFNLSDASSDSITYKVSFDSLSKVSKFELSGPKGYLFHKPIIVMTNQNALDHLKLPLINEKVLFGENMLINFFHRLNTSNDCDMFRNKTYELLTDLKSFNFSELGAPRNSSKLWHAIEVDLKGLGDSCENFTNEMFFNFEYARSKVDNINHQNLLKRVYVSTGSPGKVKVTKSGDEYGVKVKFGVMFFDLTEISYKNGQLEIRGMFNLILIICGFSMIRFLGMSDVN